MSLVENRGIRVDIKSDYIEAQSDPDNRHYFFAYHVRIVNTGSESVQLLSRHWIITNGNGETQEVRGPGVVGEQPLLEPGTDFRYSSFCPIDTPVGTMHGSYQMVASDGSQFDVRIAPFTLAAEEAVFH